MELKLRTKMVKAQVKRMGLRPPEIAVMLGYKSRQGYYDMLARSSCSRVDRLSEILGIDKESLVVIE